MPKITKHKNLTRLTAIVILCGFLSIFLLPAFQIYGTYSAAHAEGTAAQDQTDPGIYHAPDGKTYVITNPTLDAQRELSGNPQVKGTGTDLLQVVARTGGTVATRLLGGWTGNLIFGLDSSSSGLVKTTIDSITGGFVMMIFNWLVGDDFATKVMTEEGRRSISFETTMMSPGLVMATSQGIGAIYANPPVLNTAHVVKNNLATNLLNPETAYAAETQTRGFSFYEGASALWQKSLAFSLGISLIIMVLVGFSIMFSGTDLPVVGSLGLKNRIQVTQALPQIFFALFFAVFSLTIAAFAMDVVNVVGGIVIAQFPTPGIFEDIATYTNSIADQRVLNPELLNSGSEHASYLFGGVGVWTVARLLAWPTLKALFMLGDEAVGSVSPLDFNIPDVDIFGIILAIMVLIYIFYMSIKIFFTLVKRYLMLYIAVIFAPPLLIAAALPGRQGLISGWLRTILVNSAVFPAILIALHIGYFLIEQLLKVPFSDPFTEGIGPSFVGPSFNPLTGHLFFIALASMAILHIVSEIPGYLDRTFGTSSHPLFSGMGNTYKDVRKHAERTAEYVQKPATTITDKVGSIPIAGDLAYRALPERYKERLDVRYDQEDRAAKERGSFASAIKRAQGRSEKYEKVEQKEGEKVSEIYKDAGIKLEEEEKKTLIRQNQVSSHRKAWDALSADEKRNKYSNQADRFYREKLKDAGMSTEDVLKTMSEFSAAQDRFDSLKTDNPTWTPSQIRTAMETPDANGRAYFLPGSASTIDEMQEALSKFDVKTVEQRRQGRLEARNAMTGPVIKRLQAEHFRRTGQRPDEGTLRKNENLVPALLGMFRTMWQGQLITSINPVNLVRDARKAYPNLTPEMRNTWGANNELAFVKNVLRRSGFRGNYDGITTDEDLDEAIKQRQLVFSGPILPANLPLEIHRNALNRWLIKPANYTADSEKEFIDKQMHSLGYTDEDMYDPATGNPKYHPLTVAIRAGAAPYDATNEFPLEPTGLFDFRTRT